MTPDWITGFKHLVRGGVLANRLRVNALFSLAMLNVCTLGAGVAVAALLPARGNFHCWTTAPRRTRDR